MEEKERQLPQYAVKSSEDFPGWLVVTCPYEDCADSFLVRKSRWLKPVTRTSRVTGQPFTILGRSCPYCFRVGRIPARRGIR